MSIHPSLRQLRPPRFPWRGGNRFELLVDGANFLPRMLQAIHQAQQSIDLEMYLVQSGHVWQQFSAALNDAAARGVKVRLLLDDYGSRGLLEADRRVLRQQGIQVEWYNRLRWRKGLSNLLRDHRKLLLVDQHLAFVGGAGLTDEFSSGFARPWHEVMVAIQGPVVHDWRVLFERVWLSRRARWLKPPPFHHAFQPVGDQQGRVCASSGLRAHHIAQSLYLHIHQATQRIWLATPYFVPSLKLRLLLLHAARRGVDVRLLAPGPHTDHPGVRHASHRYYATLLRQGVRIFEYQPRFLHAKLALCDSWVSVGSSNFDRWNLLWNLDANQEVIDTELSTQIQQLFEADFAQSIELSYATWTQRPLHLRFLEWWHGRIERWLSRLR